MVHEEISDGLKTMSNSHVDLEGKVPELGIITIGDSSSTSSRVLLGSSLSFCFVQTKERSTSQGLSKRIIAVAGLPGRIGWNLHFSRFSIREFLIRFINR